MMSKRLQVALDEGEYRDLQRAARKRGLTVSQWVREALRAMRRQEPVGESGKKLSAVREAARHAYETADIDQMLEQIESGYLGGGGHR
jgi:hypothetical protein